MGTSKHITSKVMMWWLECYRSSHLQWWNQLPPGKACRTRKARYFAPLKISGFPGWCQASCWLDHVRLEVLPSPVLSCSRLLSMWVRIWVWPFYPQTKWQDLHKEPKGQKSKGQRQRTKEFNFPWEREDERPRIPQKQTRNEFGRIALCALKFEGLNTSAKYLQKESNKVSQPTVVTAKPNVIQK